MVQCERRKKHKTIPKPCRRAEKAPHGRRKTQHVRGVPGRRARVFCVFAFMYFCAAPLKLRHSRRAYRGGARRLPRSDNVCPGGVLHRPQKTPPAARGRKILCVKSRCAMRLLFRRCRRVLPAWCRPPGTPVVGASAESFDAARFGTLPKTGYLPSSSPFVAVGKPMGKQRFPLRCCKRARRFIAAWNIKPPGVVKPAPCGSVHFHQPCPKAGAVQADDAGHGDVVYHKGDVAHQEQQPRERDAHALEFLDNGADGKQK